MAFGEDENSSGMTWDRLKSYLQNPSIAAQAMKSGFQGAQQEAQMNLANTTAKAGHLDNPNYQPSPDEIQNEMAKNEELQGAAGSAAGSLEDIAARVAKGGRFAQGAEHLVNRLEREAPQQVGDIRNIMKDTQGTFGKFDELNEMANAFYNDPNKFSKIKQLFNK